VLVEAWSHRGHDPTTGGTTVRQYVPADSPVKLNPPLPFELALANPEELHGPMVSLKTVPEMDPVIGAGVSVGVGVGVRVSVGVGVKVGVGGSGGSGRTSACSNTESSVSVSSNTQHSRALDNKTNTHV